MIVDYDDLLDAIDAGYLPVVLVDGGRIFRKHLAVADWSPVLSDDEDARGDLIVQTIIATGALKERGALDADQ